MYPSQAKAIIRAASTCPADELGHSCPEVVVMRPLDGGCTHQACECDGLIMDCGRVTYVDGEVVEWSERTLRRDRSPSRTYWR